MPNSYGNRADKYLTTRTHNRWSMMHDGRTWIDDGWTKSHADSLSGACAVLSWAAEPRTERMEQIVTFEVRDTPCFKLKLYLFPLRFDQYISHIDLHTMKRCSGQEKPRA